MKPPASGFFQFRRGFNYRLWAVGAFVSNIGVWGAGNRLGLADVHPVAHHDASAVGLVIALQLRPQLLLLPQTSLGAKRFNQRKLLMATHAKTEAKVEVKFLGAGGRQAVVEEPAEK